MSLNLRDFYSSPCYPGAGAYRNAIGLISNTPPLVQKQNGFCVLFLITNAHCANDYITTSLLGDRQCYYVVCLRRLAQMPCFANDHQGPRLQERKQLPIALPTYQCLMPSKETTASFEEKEPPDLLSPVSSPTQNVSDYPPPLAAQLSDSEYLIHALYSVYHAAPCLCIRQPWRLFNLDLKRWHGTK